ncbi:choice-of-anchor J domain-containing protein [Paracrocinitomix mangrovi]|uniref:T9SS-dependent choice-of-anchor J family protein n=1 Tax=Paracrocinitomix mangrovi TaxID=2862509 RepID=UPI001C8DB125|nr:choice-of-anchor J domain-containing protein [Paracrocinitomix mangrovi]UKN01183.1 choice-of-anchor J domain-containing protein [Paracrocinitomix mangrovi]
MNLKLYSTYKLFFMVCAIVLSNRINAQITENFDDITTLTGSGWIMQNNSSPLGSTDWFQGNATAFAAFNGAGDSYIGANFNNTSGVGTISNWLLTPNVTLKNGDVITFYTRTTIDNMWADNLQVRMSTNGASTNVGATATSVGDFSTVLLEINPTLALSTYPMAWTQYSITISGLTAPTSGRLAFRYFVTNAGPSGSNSDYIGIDAFVYTPYVCPTLTVTPGTLNNGTAGTTYGEVLGQTGALGTASFAVVSGTLPPGVTLGTNGTFSGSPTATGTYTFTVEVTDQSGCTGTQTYSLTIDCPTNGATLAAFPDMCEGDSPLVLTQGSPSGGTYSGTGVTGSQFDPSAGTSAISYSLTDVYGCVQTAVGTITVNPLPTVTLDPFSTYCEGAAAFALSGGNPTGGTYSGTGVSGGMFNPATAGTFTVTYTYMDGNGCTNTANADVVVADCLGLPETNGLKNFSCYPNPTNGELFVQFNESTAVDVSIRVVGANGQVVSIEEIKDVKGQFQHVLDLSSFDKGIYVIEVTTPSGTGIQRIVLQ